MPKKINPNTPLERPTPSKEPEIQDPVDPKQPDIPVEDPDINPEEDPYQNPPDEMPPPAEEM
jgi:hypothetical protein